MCVTVKEVGAALVNPFCDRVDFPTPEFIKHGMFVAIPK